MKSSSFHLQNRYNLGLSKRLAFINLTWGIRVISSDMNEIAVGNLTLVYLNTFVKCFFLVLRRSDWRIDPLDFGFFGTIFTGPGFFLVVIVDVDNILPLALLLVANLRYKITSQC